MNALATRIARRISTSGPITVADYMSLALTDPDDGYYMRQDPFGRQGDFTTAPEISQMFGELLGLWCTEVWQRMGRPARFQLVELGPGRGTLMTDMLRAATLVEGFLDAAEVHLVEVSPALRAHQEARLRKHAVTWHESLSSLPAAPMILVANEFFDALPIQQFQRSAAGWCERRVALDEAGALTFALDPHSGEAALAVPPGLRNAPVGSLVEVSLAGQAVMTEIAQRVVAEGGAALVIDFGPGESAPGESLQAVRRHAVHAVLDTPGEADLTAHVDFAKLLRTAQMAGARTFGPIAQGRFLRRLGLDLRAKALMSNATDSQARDIAAAQHRLTGGQEMGQLFKAIAVADPELGPLDDLETEADELHSPNT